MNIKSILLGSAAALVAVTGARAADAVVMVEPEPVEYVRVCDVYGTGFFYIPGTETCLKIGGYVRARVYAGTNDGVFNSDLDEVGEDYGTNTEVRARLDFDAREETELGTLRAKIRVQATNDGQGFDTPDEPFGMDEGFIQLGGLTVGYLDSLWTDGDGLLLDNDWAAGDQQQNRISYTYAANGFSGTVSLEDDGTGDFVPDVLAKLAYEGGFGGAYIIGLFDEQQLDLDGNYAGFNGARFGVSQGVFGLADVRTNDFEADDSAFALKAGITLENLIAEDSTFKIEGHYAFDPTAYAVVDYVVGNNYGLPGRDPEDFDSLLGASGLDEIPSEYQIGAAYTQQFGKLFAGINGVYGKTFDLDVNFAGDGLGFFVDLDGADYYGGAINVGYDITTNLSVLGEISYVDIDTPAGLTDYDQTAGFIEIMRTF